MKILDKYILKTFLKTFLSIFFILIFIFILQSVWQFVKELAGKDLDLVIVSKFLIYLLPTLVPLILPLTILLASIMVFGDFSENYEFAAMKSAGISLQRAMRGLSIFIFFLSVITFFFANNVVPWGAYELRNLRINIAKLTPAMAIAEGQFTTIGNINIKVDKKSGENGSHLEGVILHQIKRSKITDNHGKNLTVIKAESGDLVSSKNSNVLQLILYNGYYYNDIFNRDPRKRNRNPHAKSAFEKYTMNIDLSKLNEVDLNAKNEKVSYKMLKINQLRRVVDSLEKKRINDIDVDVKNTINSLNIFKYAANKKNQKIKLDLKLKQEKKPNSLPKNPYPAVVLKNKKEMSLGRKDSILKNKLIPKPVFLGNYLSLFTLKQQEKIVNFAIVNSKTNYKRIEAAETKEKYKTIAFNQYKMAMQNKFALALSCFILFFVGAPLGAIIRKGGMGLPMVMAIGLFLTYYFLGIFSHNSAESGTISTFFGAWLPTLILLPLGIMLTRNATSDKGVFNADGMTLFFENIWNKISKKKKKQAVENKINLPKKEEKLKGIAVFNIKEIQKEFSIYSKTTTFSFVAYSLVLALFPLLQTQHSKIILTLIVILLLVYLVFYGISFKKYTTIKQTQSPNYTASDKYVDFFFGITSYPLAYFYYRTEIKNLKEKLENN